MTMTLPRECNHNFLFIYSKGHITPTLDSLSINQTLAYNSVHSTSGQGTPPLIYQVRGDKAILELSNFDQTFYDIQL